jgi:exo-poly-alpha-galacturonosidase
MALTVQKSENEGRKTLITTEKRLFPRGANTALINKLRVLLIVGLVSILGAGDVAQGEIFAPPPPPQIPPLISTTYSNDLNRNAIDDELESKATMATTQLKSAITPKAVNEAKSLLTNIVDIELVFKNPVTQRQIDDFQNLGGQIVYMYKAASYGWNGRIALEKVSNLPSLMGATMVLAQEAKPVVLHLDVATRTGRVRPVWATGFAGNPAGFDGASTITIAILDTGIDANHSDLSGRQVYWQDFSDDGASSPVDIIEHGSHVAGIALGTGTSSGSGTSTLYYTDVGDLTDVPNGAFYAYPIGLPTASVAYSSTAKWTGGGSTNLYQVYHTKGINGGWAAISAAASGSSPQTETNTFTGASNQAYSSALLSNGGVTVKDFVITNSATNYPGVGDGFNKLRGVAPGCNWAAAKVFSNDGSGYSTWISAAIDDLVATRAANNIKVMNLSLGTDGNPGIDPTLRQKVNTAVNNGIVVVISAGNDGLETTAPRREIDDPGRAAMALTVAACNDEDQLTDYSSQGFSSPSSVSGQEEDYKPDISAPGGSASYYTAILSVDSGSGDGPAFADQQSNDYSSMQGTQGTSMASPFAAGAAALVIDAMEQQGITWDFDSSQHSQYVKMVLCATASETNMNREGGSNNPTLQRASNGSSGFPAGKDLYEGYGIINPDAAVEAISMVYAQGSVASGTLGPGTYDRRVWARKVVLNYGSSIRPVLTVPSSGDFDLYLYSATPNSYGTPIILASSTRAGNDLDEFFTYVPPADADALLVVKRISGSGTFSLAVIPDRVLTVTSTSGGTVTTPGIGTYTYPYGIAVNIAATANTHNHFVNWSGTGVTAGKVANPNLASTTITMDANYTVQANFAIDQKSLTTSATAGGTVTTPGIGTYFYPYGSDANIVATANPSHHFMNWTGTAVTSGKVSDPFTTATKVIMDGNYTVQANFAINQYTITATADANGSISPSGTIVKNAGESQIFIATPNTGYTVDTWLVDGSVVQAGSNAYILENIGADHTVQVNFIIDERSFAFPGAEGSGCFAKGGRGGDVYEVNNLNNSGLGSIVDAVSEGNRTIVFRVSGTILLGDVMLQPKSNTTIAGQTAPGDGICIKGRIYIQNVSNVIIRYLRVRVDEGAANSNGDAIDIDGSNRIIIDHVTVSYSRDEGISCREDTDNITVQWCIISEALTFENHSYGSLMRGQFGNTKTYHHNLYAHNKGRNPRPGNYVLTASDPEGLHFDFRNNVVYNWSGSTAGNNDDGSGSNVLSVSRYNFIGNVYIPGPESTSTSSRRGFRERCKVSYGYFANNSYDGIVSADPWNIVNFDSGYMTSSDITAYKARSYLLPMEPVTTTSPAQAKIDVLTDAGASFPKRDIIDARIVDNVLNKTGHSIYNTDEQPEGGWPTLNSLPAPTDSDHDGMPDKWETLHHLNANDAADRNNYDFSIDYTNLEVYLNGLLVETLPQVNWTQSYNGTANGSDYAKDIVVDSNGDVIVSGYAKNTGTDYDFVTIKYTPDGNMVWKKTYSCPGSYADFASAMAVDADSNIVVAGYSYTATNYDGIIVKYNSSGSQLWAQKYNYSAGPLAIYSSADYFYDVATDSNGNIYAVGRKDKDCLVVKYTPDGVFSWARIYNGAANGWDILYSIVIDSSGNVYACGETAGIGTDQDCLTLKYSPDGTLLWAKTYNGSTNGQDMLEAIVIDSAGNAYVTGSVETATDSNYVTIKYSPDGNSLWTAFYSGTATGWDESYAIAVTSDSNIAVTGYSKGAASADAATVKYDSQTGSQLWAVRYNGVGNSTDYAEAIATDRVGNVYVHGRSAEIGSTDYLTICYDSSGIQQWKMNYDGPALLTDTGTAIAVDNGIVYVTGCSMAADGTYDYATIRYTQHNYCPGDMSGDLSGDCKVDFFDFVIMANDFYNGEATNFDALIEITDNWLECSLLIPEDCPGVSAATITNSPQNLMVPPMGWDDTQIILIWSKPDDYSKVTDYRVYQDGIALGLSGRFDTNKPKLYYIVTGLTANTTYNFTVKSVLSGGGESAASNTCTKTTTATPTVLNIANPPYNASNDGITKNTAAIQQAINDCPDGGVVLVPAGGTGYLTGGIYLKSNMTLRVDGTLIGACGSEATDYLQTSLRVPYYKGGNNFMGLVNAYNNYTDPASAGKPYILENIRICGSGTISGDIHDPGTGTHVHTHVGYNEAAIIGDDARIGDMITIKGVTNFYLGGWGSGTLTLQRPPEHTMFISYCNGVTVNAINVTTYDLHNGDGLNLATSDTAYIFNSTFDTGDDCINMNAGQGLMGVTENVPCQNVRCFDCITLRGHGGFVIGSFTAAWVQDCVVEDLLINGTDIGIRQKTGSNNGGGGRRNLFRDIRIINVPTWGVFLDSTYSADSYYGNGGAGQFSNNTYKNITVNSTSPSIYVNGLSGTPHNNNIFDHITGNNAASLNWCTNSTFSYITVTAWSPYTNCSGNINGGNNSPVPPF